MFFRNEDKKIIEVKLTESEQNRRAFLQLATCNIIS